MEFIRIRVRFRDRVHEGSYRRGITIKELLTKLGLNPEEVVVALNGEIVPEDSRLTESCEIEVLPVVSGGFR